MSAVRRSSSLLALILVVYFVLAGLYAARTPAWQAPDEPAHYNYIAFLVAHGQFPVLMPGDYPHDYLEEIKAAGFPADMSIGSIRYESHQPPLYYALAAPIFSVAGGALLPLRLFSVLLGAGIVVLAFLVARRTCPDKRAVALGTAALVAFLPQHLVTVSQVGNDVLAELLVALVLLQLVGWPGIAPEAGGSAHSRGSMRAFWLGLTLGAVLITKTTAYVAIPLAGGVIVWSWLRNRGAFPLGRAVSDSALVILPAAAAAFPWYARNIAVYGWPDFLGLQRHDAIVAGQLRPSEFLAANGWNAYIERAIKFTFESFWGVFGWLGVFMDERVYQALAVLTAVVAAGLVLRVIWTIIALRSGVDRPPAVGAAGVPPRPLDPLLPLTLLFVSALLTTLVYIWYNVQFVQHQGRYLFTALIPLALGFALGWEEILQRRSSRIAAAALIVLALVLLATGVFGGGTIPKWPVAFALGGGIALALSSRLPLRLSPFLFALPYIALPLIDLYALYRVILPALS